MIKLALPKPPGSPAPTTVLASLLTLGALFTHSAIQAQDDEEAVFELSPFVVDGSGDVGYAAQNTLAGSRLNTELKDVAAPVEVFTKEFLEDIAADSIEDALEYHSNAQEDLGDENSGMQQDYKMQAQVRTRYKVRGMPQTRSRDYFRYHLPLDFFSTERVDASRGPNSILFGIGNAGGVTNITSKQALLGRNRTSVGIKAGDDSLLRLTLDHNQVIVEDTFALRLNLLHQDGGAWHAYGRNEKEGIQLATKWRLSEKTTIRTDFEYGTKGDMATRTFPVQNRAHYWDLAGRPTFDLSTVRTNGNLSNEPSAILTRTNPNTGADVSQRVVNGVRNDGTERFVFIDNDGTFFSSNNRYESRNLGDPQLGQDVIYGTMINGPSAERDLTYKTWSAFIEQKVTRDIHLELAYNHYERDWYASNFGNEAQMKGEASTFFYRNAPDGDIADGASVVDTVPHDFGGLYYYEDDARNEVRYGDFDSLRLTASYELDTERLGTHRFAAMVSTEESTAGVNVKRAAVLTNPDGTLIANPEHGRNRVFLRHYITNESDPADFRNADMNTFPSSFTDPFTGHTYQTGFANITDRFSESSVDSKLIAMQNYFLNNRLVTTFGYRRDDANTKAFGTSVIGDDGLPTGEVYRDALNNKIYNREDVTRDVDQESSTRTFGVVYHLNNYLSLTFNDSENNGPPYGGWGAPNTTESIDLTTLRGTQDFEPWAPTGSGRDYGLKLNLLNGKVFLTANYFETSGTGALTWRDTGLDNRFAEIVRSLYGDQPFNETPGAGQIGLLQFDGNGNIVEDADGVPIYEAIPALIPEAMPRPNFRTQDDDFESEGYELNMTANLSENLTMRMGYSYSTRRVFDRWAMVRAFSDKMREWLYSGRDFDASLLDRLPMRRVNSFDETEGTGSIVQDSSGRYYLFANDVLDFNVDQWVENDLENAQEGFGQRKHKANIWARYRFTEGALKGFEVAGGLRYQSGAEIGYFQFYDENGNLQKDRDIIQESGSRTFNDLALVYKTQANWLRDGATMRLQLNVKNVFNDNDYDVSRYRGNSFGELYAFRYYVPTPRQTSVSATFKF